MHLLLNKNHSVRCERWLFPFGYDGNYGRKSRAVVFSGFIKMFPDGNTLIVSHITMKSSIYE